MSWSWKSKKFRSKSIIFIRKHKKLLSNRIFKGARSFVRNSNEISWNVCEKCSKCVAFFYLREIFSENRRFSWKIANFHREDTNSVKFAEFVCQLKGDAQKWRENRIEVSWCLRERERERAQSESNGSQRVNVPGKAADINVWVWECKWAEILSPRQKSPNPWKFSVFFEISTKKSQNKRNFSKIVVNFRKKI